MVKVVTNRAVHITQFRRKVLILVCRMNIRQIICTFQPLVILIQPSVVTCNICNECFRGHSFAIQTLAQLFFKIRNASSQYIRQLFRSHLKHQVFNLVNQKSFLNIKNNRSIVKVKDNIPVLIGICIDYGLNSLACCRSPVALDQLGRIGFVRTGGINGNCRSGCIPRQAKIKGFCQITQLIIVATINIVPLHYCRLIINHNIGS